VCESIDTCGVVEDATYPWAANDVDETVLETGWDRELCSDLVSADILIQGQVRDGAGRSGTGAARKERTWRKLGEW